MTAHAMRQASLAMLDALTEEERKATHLPFDDPRRQVWMDWPCAMSGDIYPGFGLTCLTFSQRSW